MAVPKRRKSPSAKGMRRSHDFLVAPPVNICPQCKLAVPPHKGVRPGRRMRQRTAEQGTQSAGEEAEGKDQEVIRRPTPILGWTSRATFLSLERAALR